MKLRNIFFTVLATILLIGAGITWLVGSYFIDFALKRGNATDPKAPPKASAGIITPNLSVPSKPVYDSEVWNIKIDNENRTATAFYAQRKTDKWIVMIHGYCRDQRYTWSYADEYLSHGFNVLTPDLNASGKSEGQFLTMGIKESKDIAAWVKLLTVKNKNSRIALHGISMGAATAMLATEERLPANVYAVIEDCGYASAYEMYGLQAEKMFGIPRFPVLNMIDIVHKIKLGCYMSDAAPIRAVRKCQLPILFIHGDKDELVPLQMGEQLYAESTSKLKEKYIVHGAGHARSVGKSRSAYFSRVYKFLDRANQQ